MPVDGKASNQDARFSWILRGASHGADGTFDADLADFREAAIIPTRGAVVPEWLLIVPRAPCLSLADLDRSARRRLVAIAEVASTRVTAVAGASVMFEHGPRRRGSVTGCGVDQAHVHVVGDTLPLLERLVDAATGVTWLRADHDDPWGTIPPGSEYLVIRDGKRAVRALVNDPVSQCLRRAMAAVLGLEEEWDYRSHPNARNARRTREIFHGAFADASV